MSTIEDLGDLEPRHVVVKAGGRYWLVREASEAVAVAYREFEFRCRVFDENGKFKGFQGLNEIEPMLVGRCVYTPVDPTKEDAKPQVDEWGNWKGEVGEREVRSWGSVAVQRLFAKVREISPGLNELPTTVESVDKQIGELQQQRARLVALQEGKPDPKAQSAAGTGN